jgi:hypothetical protein
VWVIRAWQGMSPEVNVNGLKKCCISSVVGMGLVMICCGMKVKRMGMLGVSVRRMKAMTVKMETVTLLGKGRYEVRASMNYNFFVVQKWKVEALFLGYSPTWCLLLCSFISCEGDE